MIKKLIKEVKEYILEEYRFLIFLLLSLIIFLWPVDYYITIGGGISSMDERISVEEGYKSKGSFNLSYVRQLDGTVGIYLLSFIIPSWEREAVSDYKYEDTDTLENIEFRHKVSLWESSSLATKWAYTLANRKFSVTDHKIYVTYTFEEYPNNFEVGDILLSINGKKFNSINEYSSYIESLDSNNSLDVLVKRDGKEVAFKSKIYEIDQRKVMGVGLNQVYEYETKPKAVLKYKENESGSSAGLMMTLSLYDKLIKDDLTHSLKIAGTGAIDEEGNVLEIGGVKYKLRGAVSGGADIFLVPSGENYEECIKIKKEKDYDIEIVEVKTINEAISFLESLGEEDENRN